MNPDQQTAQNIMDEKRFESDAKKASALLKEFAALMGRMDAFVKSTGSNVQDPVGFCRSVILSYGMKKLDDKIIKPQ